MSVSLSKHNRRSAVVGAALAAASLASLLAGCSQRPADLTGKWKDVSVDGAGALSAVDRDRMRYHLELKPDGTGTFTTGGTPRKAAKPVDPKPHDIQWSVNGSKLVIRDKENHTAAFSVSDDHKAITGDGANSTFSKDIVSFVKEGQ